MSDEPTKEPIYHYVKAGDQEAATVHADGHALVVVMHGAADLPAGSLVTITVRVGPEQPAPAPEPEQPAVKRYMGGPRINQGAA